MTISSIVIVKSQPKRWRIDAGSNIFNEATVILAKIAARIR